MTEARVAIWLRWSLAGVVALAVNLGCGTDVATPRDGGPDGALATVDAAVDAPVKPAADAAPEGPPRDVREVLLDAALPCTEAGTCADPSSTCCNGGCVDTHKDPRNCGACGQACSAIQFCTGMACTDAVFANICGNPSATVIKDPYPADNDTAAGIGAALMTSCMPPTVVMARDQGEPGVLSPGGRPLAGSGTSYLIGGGSFGQRAVDYLDKTDMTPLFLTGDSMKIELHNRGTGEVVVSVPPSTLNESHDYFYVQLFVEPLSGTLCVNSIGMFAAGTVAGGFWLATEIIPKRAMYTDTWYAYEWTDSGDKIPNAADTFRLVAHGR
jgi:hypothetical protein